MSLCGGIFSFYFGLFVKFGGLIWIIAGSLSGAGLAVKKDRLLFFGFQLWENFEQLNL